MGRPNLSSYDIKDHTLLITITSYILNKFLFLKTHFLCTSMNEESWDIKLPFILMIVYPSKTPEFLHVFGLSLFTFYKYLS